MCGQDTWLPLKTQSTDADEIEVAQKTLVEETSPVSWGVGRNEHCFPFKQETAYVA